MIVFVTGIDTEIGKTIAAGWLAAWLQAQGCRTVTQKLVQTGNAGESEDLLVHRRFMRSGFLPEDHQRLTCPAIYPFPGSPHLAAQLVGETIDVSRVVDSTLQLAARYDIVVIEGAGGLFVPLTRRTKTIDVVAGQMWPVVLVTAPRLGSINHTLLSLEAIRGRGLELAAVIYNLYYSAPPEIVADTRRVFQETVVDMGMNAPVIDLPEDADAEDAARWSDAGLFSLLQYVQQA